MKLIAKWTTIVVMIIISTTAAVNVTAQEEAPWRPPVPSPTSKDWLRMSSGEWLRGEIKSKDDKQMEFDSEDLDMLTLDWDDIVELRSPRIMTYTFTQRRVVTGTAAMRDGRIKVQPNDGGEVQEFDKYNLLSIIEGIPKELNYWSFKASASTVVRSGNTDQTDLTSNGRLRRDATRTRIDLGYNGNFSELADSQTVNNHTATLTYDIVIYRSFFITPVKINYYADRFQNIDYRVSYSMTVGYIVVRTSSVEWLINVGGGYQETRNLSVEAGTPQGEESGQFTWNTSLDYDITGDIEFDLRFSSQRDVPENGNVITQFVSFLDIDLWSIFDLTMQLTWDRVSNPVPRADSSVPQQNDFRTTIGFGIDI